MKLTTDQVRWTGHLTALGCFILGTGLGMAVDNEARAAKTNEIDPRQLLKTAAEARSQLATGEIEFEVTSTDFGHPLEGTNHLTLRVVFDGNRCRCESSTREYMPALAGPDVGEATDAKLKEMKLVRGEAAVQAGLLRAFDRHRVTSYDGVQLLDLSDLGLDRSFFQTRICAPGEGGSYVFNPRILGLTPTLSLDYTIEFCLPYRHAELVTLVGADSVEGVAAWHVRASYPSSPNSLATDLWIEQSHPSHVLKCQWNGDTVVWQFDPAHPEDLMPLEVRTVRFYGPERGRLEDRIVRRTARNNVPVDPTSWTLAGLNMPVGTEVVGSRPSRSLGYWNGTGLSEDPPPGPAQGAKPKTSINLPRLRELAATQPESLFAAHVYLTEAYLLKGEETEGIDERQSAEIEALFQRTISASRTAGPPGLKLLNVANDELSQLRRCGLGRVAPETEGEGMHGEKIKLSDCRGKVVVLAFWATWCPPCMAMVPEERKLVERMTGKPFALLGINADDATDQANVRDIMGRNNMTWPSLRDGKSGPIASAWNVHNWPTLYVLDTKGVVRYRNVRGQALADAVDALIREGM